MAQILINRTENNAFTHYMQSRFTIETIYKNKNQSGLKKREDFIIRHMASTRMSSSFINTKVFFNNFIRYLNNVERKKNKTLSSSISTVRRKRKIDHGMAWDYIVMEYIYSLSTTKRCCLKSPNMLLTSQT